MILLRSILFAIFFYPWTAIMVLCSFPASLFGTRAVRACAHGWARGHRILSRWLLGITLRVEGRVPDGAVMVAAKHQSMYETLAMLLLMKEPAIVMKRELTEIPFWGWVVRHYDVIPVDRAGGAASLRRMMRAAEKAVAENRPILIFPEGTRVPVGEQPPLQPGFAGLYRALRLPVVPVAIDSGRLWPPRRFVKQPGVITFRVGDLIPAGLGRSAIETEVHREINRLEPTA